MIYLDASVVGPLFIQEARSSDARAIITGAELLASPLTSAETSSLVARRVRENFLLAEEAVKIFGRMDQWFVTTTAWTAIEASDWATAMAYVRTVDLALRTPDAIHVAIAQRVGASLATFDRKLAASAAALGVRVIC